MKLTDIKKYIKDTEIKTDILYTKGSAKMEIYTPTEITVSGTVLLEGALLPEGKHNINNTDKSIVLDPTNGNVIIHKMREKPKDVEQYIPLPEPNIQEDKDFRHIIAVFEKWAQARGITQDIQPVKNVDIDDIDYEYDEAFDMPLDVDSTGLIEEQIPDIPAEPATQEPVAEATPDPAPSLDNEPTEPTV